MPTRTWLLRHAETATPNVFHGAESDIGLSALGAAQASAAADWFTVHKPDIVISSAMRRAVDTASPIAAACGVPHLLEPELHERRVGALCGTSFETSGGPWAETLTQWCAGETAFTTPGAESYDDLRLRLLPVWERIAAAHAGRRIVVVAHGIVCKILLLSLLPDRGPTQWHALGRVLNVAVSELVRTPAGSWEARVLLEVPPPVAALISTAEVRSEA